MAANCTAPGNAATWAARPGVRAQSNSTIAGFRVSSVITWTSSALTKK